MKKRIDVMWQNLVQRLVFLSLLALPWINSTRISTFLFIAIGILLIAKKEVFKINYTNLGRQVFFLVFIGYYILQIAAFFFYPEKMNHAAIEQKASLVAIPFIFYVLINRYENIWKMAKYGFITGNILASATCLIIAINQYLQSADIGSFFYHHYSSAIGLSAIYFSFYIVIALIYTFGLLRESYFTQSREKTILLSATAIFLFINLILLSSKTVLIIGSLLVLLMLSRQVLIPARRKAAIGMALMAVCLGILFTNNPVSERYKAIHINTYSAALYSNNFKNFAFDGLNLRLLLWRMGFEITGDNKSWLAGNGGKHFHQVLNEKIISYSLYTGDGKKNDKGYLNYNLHNQYMESYIQFGIIGLLLIVILIASCIYFSIKHDNEYLIYIIVLFAFVFLTESVMETQAGILLITIFISGEWILTQQKLRLKQAI